MVPFPSQVAVAYGRAILAAPEQRVGYRVEQLLGAAVAQGQNALAADAIVDRKATPYQRKIQLARDGVALAAADQEIRRQAARHFAHFGEIHALAYDDALSRLARHRGDSFRH